MERRSPPLHEAADDARAGGLERLQVGVADGEHALDEAGRRLGLVAAQTEQGPEAVEHRGPLMGKGHVVDAPDSPSPLAQLGVGAAHSTPWNKYLIFHTG